MSALSFACSRCGKRHEGLPALGFGAPAYWDEGLRETDPDKNRLESDICIIQGTNFFIRGLLEVPVKGTDAVLVWNLWVTQSEANFHDYVDSLPKSPARVTFGYLANRLPGYADSLNLPTQVHWRPEGLRPWIELPPKPHPLCRDWLDGIAPERAAAFAEAVLHPPGS
jgi:hypothetical protein